MSGRRFFGIDQHIGRTPLVRLRRGSELTGCEILAKAEFMDPGGSVKDRTAYGIITEAEAAGKLKPGDTIIEGTAGNTGIGLTVVGLSEPFPNTGVPKLSPLASNAAGGVKLSACWVSGNT